jgi:hypothetical protein
MRMMIVEVREKSLGIFLASNTELARKFTQAEAYRSWTTELWIVPSSRGNRKT